MKIGIMSDTHGCLQGWEKALGFFRECDLILHAGDILYHGSRNPLPAGYDPNQLVKAINELTLPLFVVRGNCDAEVEETVLQLPLMSPYFFSYIDGIRILMLHGHTLHNENSLVETGLYYGADVLVSGHTHRPAVQKKANLVLVNPGSTALPKDDPAAVGVMDTETREVQLLKLEDGECITRQSF